MQKEPLQKKENNSKIWKSKILLNNYYIRR